ncbi:MAG: hypothetical protein OEY51_14055, partial [Cyclobacteriaceae bacterium]|nr:hypothetical protein [Cyclobacteriaceae bacterium]
MGYLSIFQKPTSSSWKYRSARPVFFHEKVVLLILMGTGTMSALYLANWWFREEHIASLPYFLLLSVIFWWAILRMVFLWISYLKISK